MTMKRMVAISVMPITYPVNQMAKAFQGHKDKKGSAGATSSTAASNATSSSSGSGGGGGGGGVGNESDPSAGDGAPAKQKLTMKRVAELSVAPITYPINAMVQHFHQQVNSDADADGDGPEGGGKPQEERYMLPSQVKRMVDITMSPITYPVNATMNALSNAMGPSEVDARAQALAAENDSLRSRLLQGELEVAELTMRCDALETALEAMRQVCTLGSVDTCASVTRTYISTHADY